MTSYVDHHSLDYYTTPELMGMFGCSRAVILKMAREGRIPHAKTVTGHYRYPRDEMDRIAREGLPAVEKVQAESGSTSRHIMACPVRADGKWYSFAVAKDILHAEISGDNTITVYAWSVNDALKSARESQGIQVVKEFCILVTGELAGRPVEHCLSLKGPADGHVYHLVRAK